MKLLLVVVSSLLFALPAAARTGDSRRLVVVAARALPAPVRAAVETRVKDELARRVGLVPSREYAVHARQMDIHPSQHATVETAALVGIALDVDYVLVLQRSRPRLLEASLVNIGTNSVEMANEVRLSRRHAPGDFANVVANVVGVVGGAQQATLVAAATTFEEVEPEPEPEPTVTETVEPEEPARAVGSEAVRVAAGAAFLQRNATVRSGVQAVRTDRPLMVTGVDLALEVFPVAFADPSSPFSKFGLHVRGYAAPTAKGALSFSVDGGLTGRFSGHGTVAPAVILRVGFASYAAPVDRPDFPDTSFSGPHTDLRLQATFADLVVVFGEGGYTYPLRVGSEVGQLGSLESAHAFYGEAGVSVLLGPVEVTAGGRVERAMFSFRGAGSLPGLSDLHTAALDDTVIAALVSVGWAM